MKTFDKAIKESVPTLVVFLHHGCQDAVEVKYITDNIKTKYQGKANVVRADDPYGKLKVSYRLEEYPTYVLFKEGQELMRESGRKTETQLSEMIDRAL
ncbi:MAG: thioredoxin family protein [Muribaculaceae bacterium]|nr:thioredoxin family protein [Muribaculaceae bacterium]